MMTKMRSMTWASGTILNEKSRHFFWNVPILVSKGLKGIRAKNVRLLSTGNYSSITDQTRLNGSVS